MDKYPLIIYVGAGILGKVGAEMIFTDPIVVERIRISDVYLYGLEALLAIGVIIFGKLWVHWKSDEKP